MGCNQGLGVFFILLTSAEMIGTRSGVDFYVKNCLDVDDYTRIIAGVLLIGAVVTARTVLFNKLQRVLPRSNE
jgi:NitT/TauT family transport system permease protein